MGNPALVYRAPGREWWRPADVAGATAGVGLAPSGGVAFRASIGFMFVLLVAPQEFFPLLAVLRLALVTAAVAIIACVVDRFVRRQPLTVLTREMLLAAGLAAWAIL